MLPGMGLKSEDACYVLAFSVIMLNTDLHNQQARACFGQGLCLLTVPSLRCRLLGCLLPALHSHARSRR